MKSSSGNHCDNTFSNMFRLTVINFKLTNRAQLNFLKKKKQEFCMIKSHRVQGSAASVLPMTKQGVIQNERLSYKMKGHSNFLPCFGVIQDVFGLIEVGQNIVTIQVFEPALIPAHPSCIGNRNFSFLLKIQNVKFLN